MFRKLSLDIKFIKQKYEEGLSCQSIAKLLSVGKDTIWRRLVKYNIKRRNISECLKGKHPTTEFKKGHIPHNKGKKGKPRSIEVKQKISNTLKDKKFSKERRANMSLAHKGNKCYNWKGGITPKSRLLRNSLRLKQWREAVFKRDNWTCQKENCSYCNNQRGKTYLQAHHIRSWKEYPKLRFDINNGITYCKKSHRKKH